MKKLLCILLVLAMLLPMGVLSQAEETQTGAKAERKDFNLVNWGGYDTQFPNVYELPYFWAYSMQPGATEGKISWQDETDIAKIAQKLKERFDAQPEGTRYINYCLAATAIISQAEHVVYHDNAKKIIKDWLDEFLAEYKSIGGLLDGVIIDVEYIESHAHYLKDYYTGGRNKTRNVNIYNDIVNDPRYATQIRPLLEDMGFEFYSEPSGEKSEIWTIYRDGGAYSAISYGVWNHVMDYLERQTYKESILDVMLKYYPEAGMSDYQSGTYLSWEKAMTVSGSPVTYNLSSAGNVANCNAYQGRSSADSNPAGSNKTYREATPYNMAQFDLNMFKGILCSTPDGRIDAWLGNYEYNRYEDGSIIDKGVKSTYSGTPYYSELIFHLGLLNPEVFLGFMIPSKILRDGYSVDESMEVTSDIMVELSRVAGYADRKAIVEKANWNGDYMLTGMYAGGRNIWRITPDTDKISVEDFKVNDKAPTFRVGGLTITFPQGRIIETSEIFRAGTCGYWVETPANVKPVVTADADRYMNDPALWAHFEEYTTDTSFTNQVGLPSGAWDVSGTVMIEKGYNGNALAMYSGSVVTCRSLPKGVTAGDTYAKQQGWELSITLPAGYTGTTLLLKASDMDRGFEIAGSTLYYDENGSYKEFPGVSLTEGTYVLRRQMDFRKENAHTCTYQIFDGNGNLMGEVKDVPTVSFELPVTNVSVYASSVKEPVLVDDFCMYPMGTTTFLELYETKYGKKLDSPGVRTEETAYRMSWMNTSNYYQVAYIHDAGTREVIRKVEMAPGMDGVVTGVYNPNGKAVTFAVEVHTVPAPTREDYNVGDFDWKPYEVAYTSFEQVQPAGETVPVRRNPDDPNDPDGTQPTNPDGSPAKPGSQKNLDTGLIVLIVAAGIAVLGGGGFVLYWFAFKPKMARKAKKAQKSSKASTQEKS